MAPSKFNQSFLMGILALTFTLMTFLLKTWFEGVNANAQALDKVKQRVEVFEDRFVSISRQLNDIDGKLEYLIEKK